MLEELGYKACPTCLVARAEAFAGIAIEVFVEQRVIAQLAFAEDRAGQEDRRQALRKFAGSLAQRDTLAGSGREFDSQCIAVIMIEALERFADPGTGSIEGRSRGAAQVVRVLVENGFLHEPEAQAAIDALVTAGLIESAMVQAAIAEAQDALGDERD